MISRLLISVVPLGTGDAVVKIAKKAGARGSTVLLGKGTAPGSLLQLLCLADTRKEVVFILGTTEEFANIIPALRKSPEGRKKFSGVGIVLDVSSFLHMADNNRETGKLSTDKNMNIQKQLICIIVNAGFGYDIMNMARKAGATGGTIMKARGTGTEEDSTFFGITIVPEKELIMILANNDIYENIVNAIRSSSFLSEPGVGIIFSLPVDDFFTLGQNK